MSDVEPLGRRAPKQRQAAVVDAARELFLAHGVAKTSVDAIAKRAGVAKGTVYLYFPTKEHIVSALETQFDRRILERLRAATPERPHGAAASAWCIELVHAYLDDLDVHDLLFYNGAAAARTSVVDDLLVDDLAELLADLADPHATAAFLIGGVTAIVDHAIAHGRTADRGDIIRVVERAVAMAAAPSGGDSRAPRTSAPY